MTKKLTIDGIAGTWTPDVDPLAEVKAAHKSDRVFFTPMNVSCARSDVVKFTATRWVEDDLKLTFDGKTGKLKSAEVL